MQVNCCYRFMIVIASARTLHLGEIVGGICFALHDCKGEKWRRSDESLRKQLKQGQGRYSSIDSLGCGVVTRRHCS